jgi:2-polyprenyl-3-methyl-5-hydroxy-6-metoxy-1,4-benzoquinol methylase
MPSDCWSGNFDPSSAANGISPNRKPSKMNSTRNLTYLSSPAEVSMADRWFEIAGIDHFWVRRRFAVLRRLAGRLIPVAREIAEIGCGHGLLQRQIEEEYGREVTGFDLSEFALKHNLSRLSDICCYDIHQQDSALHERFDLVFLFDVLEHIADEDRFLAALIFHLAPGGKLVVNVPAGKWAYSAYDEAAGHIRRYSISSLREVVARSDLEITRWTYWGLPLVPALMLRRLGLCGSNEKDKIIAAGFSSRTNTLNQFLGSVSRCEPTPQRFLGTSLMAVLQVDGCSQGGDHQQ